MSSQTREEFLREKLQNFVLFVEQALPVAVSEKSLLYDLPKQDINKIILWVDTYLVPLRPLIAAKNDKAIISIGELAGLHLNPAEMKSEVKDKFFLYFQLFIELTNAA